MPEITEVRNESVAIGKHAFLHCRTQNAHATIQWLRGNDIVKNAARTVGVHEVSNTVSVDGDKTIMMRKLNS